MESPSSDQTIVLKVQTLCCPSYQKKLKKVLSKIAGVHSISLDSENNLVSVKGKMDARSLLKTVERTGKYAEILCSDTNNTTTTQHADNKRSHRAEEVREEEHKCEDYVPPALDERICRDYYCTKHNMLSMFRNTAVPEQGDEFFGGPMHMARPPPYYSCRREPRFGSSYGYGCRHRNCTIM